MKDNFLNNFEGLNVLVTGADGFVSSHLCEALIKNNANVTALLKRNSSGIFKNIDQFKEKLIVRWGDTQDLSLLHDMTKETDLIFEHDQVDVYGLMRSKKRKIITGVGYTTDKRQTVFFDKWRENLQRNLESDFLNWRARRYGSPVP